MSQPRHGRILAPMRVARWIPCLLAAPVMALAAGFDCSRAASRIERAICADAEVSQLDEYLGRYYAAARGVLGDGAECLQADQRAWLAQRNRCSDAACLRAAYLDRLAELDPLQPGATALRSVSLPPRPGLAWIVPRAADRVAAPPNPKARAMQASGVIVDEVAQGDGYVLLAPDGTRRVLVMLMFIEPPTGDRLAALARERAQVTVRGFVAREGGREYFEPSQCAYIHREPAAAQGRVFGEPGRSYDGFKPHELAFATPKDGVARGEFRSMPFFAVILKTTARCRIAERERREAQALFPAHKVFATRFGCDDGAEETITYTNVDPDRGFMALHAGATEAEGREALRKVLATGRFPGANLRRMQAVLVYP